MLLDRRTSGSSGHGGRADGSACCCSLLREFCGHLGGSRSAAARVVFATLLLAFFPSSVYPQAGESSAGGAAALGSRCAATNLREQIPEQYRERYGRWKATLLSAATGRRLWSKYACDPAFRLTVVVSQIRDQGAEIARDSYRWAGGELVAATIILGHRLDRGYPNQFYYPVLDSLRYRRPAWNFQADNILAAAKMAHEFGHIEQEASSHGSAYQTQTELSQVYTSHFMSNGYDTDDPVLEELVSRIGATPEEVHTQREHRAEAFALHFLLDKLGAGSRRKLLSRVRKSLATRYLTDDLALQTKWASPKPLD